MYVDELVLYGGNQQVSVPQDAKFISARMWYGQMTLYYETEHQGINESREIEVIGGGCSFIKTRRHRFIDTVVSMDANAVWHIYEVI